MGRLYRRGPSFDALIGDRPHDAARTRSSACSPARKLKRAARGARGDAKVVLDAILAWNGDYATTDSEGKVPPGVAAWDAFCAAARDVAVARYPKEVSKLGHSAGGSHLQECATLEAFGLRTLKRRGYRKAAVAAMAALEKQFGSKDPDVVEDRPADVSGRLGGRRHLPRAVPVLRPRHLDRAHRARALAAERSDRVVALDEPRTAVVQAAVAAVQSLRATSIGIPLRARAMPLSTSASPSSISSVRE